MNVKEGKTEQDVAQLLEPLAQLKVLKIINDADEKLP
jgi:hypothetical protein